jgi:hypothetical protein
MAFLRAHSGFEITIAGGDGSAAAIRYQNFQPKDQLGFTVWLATVHDRHKFGGECPRHRALLAQCFTVKQRNNLTRRGK